VQRDAAALKRADRAAIADRLPSDEVDMVKREPASVRHLEEAREPFTIERRAYAAAAEADMHGGAALVQVESRVETTSGVSRVAAAIERKLLPAKPEVRRRGQEYVHVARLFESASDDRSELFQSGGDSRVSVQVVWDAVAVSVEACPFLTIGNGVVVRV